jgi:hypothetical protein
MKRWIVTPAGRKRCLQILLRYLLRAKQAREFDRWILWVNTENDSDIEYMQSLAEQYDFIETRELTVPYDGCRSIGTFFPECVEDDTVYVRLDDDIVFIEPGAIDRLIRFRLANPDYFLVYGNIVNNSILSFLHQHLGAVGRTFGINVYCATADLGFKRPAFAHYVHTEFLSQLKTGNADRFRFSRWLLHDFERVCINCISWLGSEFKQFGGKVGPDEELWLSVEKPMSLGRPSCIFGEVLFAHYSFQTQRPEMDWTDILQRYEAIAPNPPVAAPRPSARLAKTA